MPRTAGRSLLIGAAAGLAGTLAMEAVQLLWTAPAGRTKPHGAQTPRTGGPRRSRSEEIDGGEADAQERVSREELFDLEMRHRGARRVRVDRVAEAVVAVAADGRVDRATARAGPSYDEPEVLAGQCPAPEEALQPLVGPMRPRDD